MCRYRLQPGPLILAVLLLLASYSPRTSAGVDHGPAGPFYLVVAQDRGFMGNSTVEEQFTKFAQDYPRSELFFVTRRLHLERLERRLKRLRDSQVQRLVVVPAAISDGETWWRGFREDLLRLSQNFSNGLKISLAPPFGKSYLASEILFDFVREVSHAPEDEHFILLGWGATDAESEKGIREDLEALLQPLLGRFKFHGSNVEVLWSTRESEQAADHNRGVIERIIQQAARKPQPILVPFFLGYRADSHMSAEAEIQRLLDGYRIDCKPQMPDEHPLFLTWMKRSSAPFERPTPKNTGVIILSHGADQVWNEEIRQALDPITKRFDTVFSFNMGDPVLLGRAVSELESRGRKHIVIYRLFALESNFLLNIQFALGYPADSHGSEHHDHRSQALPRIRSGSHLVTVGGLEDHALFAEALLDRALALSHGPRSSETVLLVAHGSGSDELDRHWKNILNSLGDQMQKRLTDPFHQVVGVTLREDWPDKRERALKEIEELVQEERSKGRRVLAVEARINGPGPTSRLLTHLDLPINDEGFVPHPNVSRVVLEAIEAYLKNADHQH